MVLFTDITLGYISVLNSTYPRVSLTNPDVPEVSGEISSMILEKYVIPAEDTSSISSAADTAGESISIYYSGNNIYASLELDFITSGELGALHTYDIVSRFESNATSFVDSDADIDNNFYLYRVTYMSGSDVGYSKYLLAGRVSTVSGYDSEMAGIVSDTLERVGSIYRMGKTKSTLYKESDGGIMVEKGIAMNHATPRYRGPIELSKERARRTALMGTQAYLDSLSDEIEEDIGELTDELSSVWNLMMSGIP